MTTWTPISYRGFWDVPRIFLFRHQGRFYLFDCLFSEELDDYPDDYEVFLLPPDLHEENLPRSWHELSALSIARLGTVPVVAVKFDATRRKQVDVAMLDALVPHPIRAMT